MDTGKEKFTFAHTIPKRAKREELYFAIDMAIRIKYYRLLNKDKNWDKCPVIKLFSHICSAFLFYSQRIFTFTPHTHALSIPFKPQIFRFFFSLLVSLFSHDPKFYLFLFCVCFFWLAVLCLHRIFRS